MFMLISLISIVYLHIIFGVNGNEFASVDANLTEIPVSSIPKDSIIIDLAKNKISRIRAKDFAGLDSLQKLTMARNLLKRVPVLNHVADTLVYLDLSFNQIRKVDMDDFKGFTVIQELYLNNNLMKQLPNLTHIADKLLKLDISKNILPMINGDYFNGFNSLEQLKIINVRLTEFPDLSVLGNTLGSLFVRQNTFPNIPVHCIQNLTLLWEFDFGFNKNLGGIPDINAVGDKLWYISGVQNNISGEISPETFLGFNSLEMINISKNYITEFPDLKYIAKTLIHLRMSNNMISYIPLHLLRQLSVLEYLHLGVNYLTEFLPIPELALSIRNVRLNGNNITSLPIISTMAVNLELYRVYDAPMSIISPESFVFLNRNQSVPLTFWLWDTLIQTIPPVVGPNINNVTILADNVPLMCDVRIAWLVLLPMKDTLEGTCYMPLELRGLAFKNLTMHDIQQTDKEKEYRAQVYLHGKLLVKDLYSNTLPMITTFTRSLQMCVQLCGKVHGCLYVNYYYHNIVDGHTNAYITRGNCHYASPYDGMRYDKPDDATGWKYYHINTQ